MTTSTDDAPGFEQYRVPLGIGLLVAGALSLLIVQGTVLDGTDSETSALQKPPMPTTEIEVAENKLIEQEAVNLDASLNLTTSPHAVTASRDE